MVVGGGKPEVVRSLFLNKPSCSVEDVIKCLEPRYTEETPQNLEVQRRVIRLTDSDKRREGLLPDVLREMCVADKDKNKAALFVLFATGMSHIPYQDENFRILIEFSFTDSKGDEISDDALPYAHTCPRDIVLPGSGYHGCPRTLRNKLEKVLDYAKYFNME